MDKRYQVFVSSTYADLKDERQKVTQTLMEMDCIPAGMELFPAADEEQFEFIKRVIDDCDYYILIIGARYGSLTADGISFTEKEYEYAMERGLRILAFIHDKPGSVPVDKADNDPDLRAKLDMFRSRVKEGRLVRGWEDAKELPGLVSLSLTKTMKSYPAVGWVRGDTLRSDDLLADINRLRKENDLLRSEAENSKEPQDSADSYVLNGHLSVRISQGFDDWTTKTVDATILFRLIAPKILSGAYEDEVSKCLAFRLFAHDGVEADWKYCEVNSLDRDELKMRLVLAQFVKVTSQPGRMEYWALTDRGQTGLARLVSEESGGE